MRKILVFVLVAAGVVSCTKMTGGDVSSDSYEKRGEVPVIAELPAESVVLRPFKYSTPEEIVFTVTGADTVSVQSDPSVDAELSVAGSGRWRLSLLAGESFSGGATVRIDARNAYGVSNAALVMEKAVFSIDRVSYESPAAGSSVSVQVLSNVGCEVSVQEECSSWIIAEYSDDGVSVDISRNNLFEKRGGCVIFSDSRGIMHDTLFVTQEAAIDYCKKEREALIALYNATGGRNWTQKSTGIGGKTISTEYWCTDMPLDQWYGVELGGDGHVTYVHIGGMNLSGTLPEEIGDLVYCQELVVSDNNLTGELPSRIGDMQALKSFQAGGNSLSGDLSLSTLSKIASKLKLISLQGNEFTGGFPQWIGDMPEQCNFWLQDNCLSGVVPQKVQSHPRWNAPSMDGSGKTIGEVNMEQKSGYVLTLE